MLRFDPSAVGERTATITIANDDRDEALYSFTIRGTGYDAITDGPSPVNYVEGVDGDLKNDTVYVPCSIEGFADEFILGVGVNRWTGTFGETGNGANQNDIFRALLPAGAFIDRITFQHGIRQRHHYVRPHRCRFADLTADQRAGRTFRV